MKSPEPHKTNATVFARQAKKEVIAFTKMLGALVIFASCVWIFEWPSWLIWLSLSFVGIFSCDVLINAFSYINNRRREMIGSINPGGVSESNDELDVDDIAEVIDLGGEFGSIKFVFWKNLSESDRVSAEAMLKGVVANKDQFVDAFKRRRIEYYGIYRYYADIISELKIDRLDVEPNAGLCEARVTYRGAGLGVWFSTFDGKGFGVLEWC